MIDEQTYKQVFMRDAELYALPSTTQEQIIGAASTWFERYFLLTEFLQRDAR